MEKLQWISLRKSWADVLTREDRYTLKKYMLQNFETENGKERKKISSKNGEVARWKWPRGQQKNHFEAWFQLFLYHWLEKSKRMKLQLLHFKNEDYQTKCSALLKYSMDCQWCFGRSVPFYCPKWVWIDQNFIDGPPSKFLHSLHKDTINHIP